MRCLLHTYSQVQLAAHSVQCVHLWQTPINFKAMILRAQPLRCGMAVMWSETIGLRTRLVWDQKNRSWSWSCRSCVVLKKHGYWWITSTIFSDVVWDKTGLRSKKKSVLVLQVWCYVVTRTCCHARRHNVLGGHSNFSSTIYSFSILCMEHHYCGDQ